MAILHKFFDQYMIDYPSGGAQSPSIYCLDGETLVARLLFRDTEGALPANIVADTGLFYLQYRLNQFTDVVNILRYEKPLYVRIGTESLVGRVGTVLPELVGEEEG